MKSATDHFPQPVRGVLNGIGLAVILSTCILHSGCSGQKHRIITATGTVIGVELAENPATQMPHAKLGYARAEFAYVPTNRPTGGEETAKDGRIEGADEAIDVLMELNYTNIFSTSGGIYQRLAVGKNAVCQPGAWAMMLRDKQGNMTADAAKVLQSIQAVPPTPPEIQKGRQPILDAYESGTQEDKQKIKEAVKKAGFDSYNAFVDNRPKQASLEDINKIIESLKTAGVLK